MGVSDRSEAREQAPGAVADPANLAPPAALGLAGFALLQRSAGNRGATAWAQLLQRWPKSKPSAGVRDGLTEPPGVRSVSVQTEGGAMVFRAEDRVVAEAESTERRPRSGTVREVLREDPPRYRIEWDDGHESIYAPAAGALRAEQHPTGTTR